MSLYDKVVGHAADHRNEGLMQNEEAVGLFFTDGHYHPLINQARSAKRFSVGEQQMGEALGENSDRWLWALFHTHPRSESAPSGNDLTMMKKMHIEPDWSGIIWLIWGTTDLQGWVWTLDDMFPDGKLIEVDVPQVCETVEEAHSAAVLRR